jgi:predicted DCC family thiol-disulfide oxidoreductase YuxK
MNTEGLTVLFDGGCPLCRRETAHYQRLTSLQPIFWLDITADDMRWKDWGITYAQAMAEFHVFDAAGRLHKGADGFIALWQALPYYRCLAWTCQTLHLLPWLRWAYGHFAKSRLQRRCAEGVCN